MAAPPGNFLQVYQGNSTYVSVDVRGLFDRVNFKTICTNSGEGSRSKEAGVNFQKFYTVLGQLDVRFLFL